jgi:hypothetical protein
VNRPSSDTDFYAGLPLLCSFAALADPASYHPVPPGWVVGIADIVRSTDAIAGGRYKEVNTAAAAVIAAVSNALPDRQIPFVFGGDGASFALSAEDAETGRVALARTASWIRDSFGLTMRVALVPVADIRAAGQDVLLARFSVSPDVSYAMFAGGGLAFAEGRMKAGDFAVEPAADGAGPNLDGLSCRFAEIPSQHGTILSIIVMPTPAGLSAFERVVGDILALAAREVDEGRPLPPGGPALVWTIKGFVLETRTAAARTGRSLVSSAIRVAALQVFSYLMLAIRRPIGGFDPLRYRQEIVRNSDFRKFDDGLRMTLDCMPETADLIEAVLRQAEREGIADVGLYRQSAALMTCFVPSPTSSDHIHFVDGAAGGYAMAAQALKETARLRGPRPG